MRKRVIEAIDNIAFMIILFVPLTIHAYNITHGEFAPWFPWLIIVPFWLNFYMRQAIKSFGALFAAHMILPLVIMVVEPLAALIPLVLSGFSLIYFYKRMPANSNILISVSAAFFSFLGFMGARAGDHLVAAVLAVMLVVVTICRVIVLHMMQMDSSLESIKPSSSQTLEKILSFNYKLVAGLAVSLMVLTIAIFLGFISPIVSIGSQLIPDLPNIQQSANGELQDIPFHDARELGGAGERRSELESSETSTFWRIVDVILRIVLGLAAFALAGYVMYIVARILLRLLKHRSISKELTAQTKDNGDEREFILPEARKKQKRRRIQHEEHPTRRRYRETVQGHVKKGIPIKKSDTPADIAKRIHAEDMTQLTNEYAQIRYNSTI